MSGISNDELAKKLEDLENKFNDLEKSLENGTHPSGMADAREVKGSFKQEKDPKFDISEDNLLDIYFHSPQIFADIAIKASLSADSYRQKTSGKTYLEKISNGNYWIISTKDGNYWLVPKHNIVINSPVMKTLESIFNCKGYKGRQTKDFVLNKPAQLSFDAISKQWKVEEPGELQFDLRQGKVSFLDSEIKQIQEERAKLQRQIEQVQKNITKNSSSPESQIIQLQELREEFQEIKKQVPKLKNQQLDQSQKKIIEKQQQQLEEAKKERQNLKLLLEKADQERQEMRLQIIKMTRSHTNISSTENQVNISSVNWENAKELDVLVGHGDSVRTVAISNWQDRQNIIASGSFDKTIKIWNLETGILINTLQETSRINAIAIHPQKSLLVSGCDENKTHIWNLDTLTSIPLEFHTNRVLAVAISKDGKTLVSGSRDHTIKIFNWTSSDLEVKHDLTEDYGTVLALEITPDNKHIISAYGDNTVRVWDLATGKLIKTIIRYSDLIWSIAISPDSKTLVCGSRDRTIQIIDLATGNIKQTLTKHTSAVWSVTISPDGNTLASGSSDNTIVLWDLNTGKAQKTLTGHSQDVSAVTFSADGQKLVSCSRDQKIRIWQA
ncbi:MAG: hypothetical protein AAGA80_26775 [Cyanobacteria bacterium P01_F01_bin.143]